MRKITIFSNMLQNSFTELTDRQQGFINKIKDASERMSNLIKDVLLYSRVSKGGDKFEPVDISKVISDTVSDYELLIEQKGAIITFDGLPVVKAIPLQMSQLFGNLMSNSLKYSTVGIQPVITISASSLVKEEYADFVGLDRHALYHKIEFSDNGIGFEAEYADKIFDIFQRLHTKSEYSGTGIGLAICKKIMENHHGDIKAEPRQEGGALFKIVMPVNH